MKVERKKGLKGIKVTHNKGVFWTAVGLFILLIAVVVSIKTIGNKENGIGLNGTIECVSDSDCIITQTSICPCSMGGSDACVSKLEALDYNFSQQTNPEKGKVICAAVFNCKIKSCSCVDGKCAGELIGE